MKKERFHNFAPDVRDLVLAFESQQGGTSRYFDVDEIEVIADYYLEVYDIDGLEAAVTYGERLFPTSDSVRLRRANLYSVRGEYPQAMALLKELERTNPANTDVCYSLATLYSMTGQSHESIAYYLKAAEDGYELDMIYGNIGDEYYKLGNTDETIRYYQMSIEKNPNEDRSLYNLACTWDEQDKTQEAVTFFTHHVEEHPYSKGGWYCLGSLYSWLSLYEKSVDAYEYALAIDATHFDSYLGLSDSYRQLGNLPKAVQALRDALPHAGDGRASVLHEIGQIYLESGNNQTASVYLHDAIKADPSYSIAWEALGVCSERMGYSDEAAGYYRRAIDLEPDVDEYWLRLADLYIYQERYAEACALLESVRVEADDPFSFDERLMFCYLKSGRAERIAALLSRYGTTAADLCNMLLSQYPEMAKSNEVIQWMNEIQKNDKNIER